MLRPYQPKKAQQTCSTAPSPFGMWASVKIERSGGDVRSHWCGLERCKSFYGCAICHQKKAVQYAELLQAVFAAHQEECGADSVVMPTFTVRHERFDGLKDMRSGLTKAYAWMASHRRFEQLFADLGVDFVGGFRALEVTHSFANGWHPHLHCAWCFSRDMTADDRAALAAGLLDLWCEAVRTVLGEKFVPNEHGVDVSPLHQSSYLAKLGVGFELTDPGSKRAADGHRSIWQIAWDLALHGHDDDAALWCEIVEGMSGAHALEPTRGKRDLAKRYAGKLVGNDNEKPERWTFCSLSLANWEKVAAAGMEGELCAAAADFVKGSPGRWESALVKLGLRLRVQAAPVERDEPDGVLSLEYG
jgi:hypothetical protein